MSISEEDKDEIIDQIQDEVQDLPAMLRKTVLPSLPEMIEKVPEAAEDYTVKELVEFLEEAWDEGRISW